MATLIPAMYWYYLKTPKTPDATTSRLFARPINQPRRHPPLAPDAEAKSEHPPSGWTPAPWRFLCRDDI